MKKYELTIVLDGGTTSAQKKSKEELVEKLLDLHKGKIIKKEDWGVKDLAYKIEKSNTGLFLYYDLELDPASVKDISEKLRLDDGIIRYLLVKADN